MPRHIVILGAGISGLATGWYLKKYYGSNVKITVLEKSSRTGGWIQSNRMDGFLFEQGPRSCRTKGTGRKTLQLVEELGIQDLLIGASSSAKRRFIYLQQRLQSLPRHPLAFPFSPLMKGWFKALKQDWKAPKSDKNDESLYAFFSRRIGSEWCHRLLDPFVSGIYAGDMHRLSIKSCFPLLWRWEAQQGSLLKGALCQSKRPSSQSRFVSEWEKRSIFSFKNGMETLTLALAEHLADFIRLNSEVKSIQVNRTNACVTLMNGEEIEADHIVSALPAHILGSLLQPINRQAAKHLHSIPYASVMVVNIGYHKPVLKQQGFGYLVPSQEREDILGCVWDSSVFPQQNSRSQETRLTVMLGGVLHPQVESYTEAQGRDIALSALRQHLGIDADPEIVHVKLSKMAIPQYEIGHHQHLKALQRQLRAFPRLTLTGNAFFGVSVNDCIAQAQKLALRLSSFVSG